MAVLIAGIELFIGMGILYVLYALIQLPRYIMGKPVMPLLLGGVVWLVAVVADRKMATWE